MENKFKIVNKRAGPLARLAILAAIVVAAGMCCLAASPAQMRHSGLAFERARHLTRGINLSAWFAQVYDTKGYTKEHFQNWITSEDVALIKSMGFDHVRLSINPQPMMRPNQADEIPADYLSSVDAAVHMILDKQLAVIIDVHPDSDFKAKFAKEDAFVEQFSDFWRAFATHYSNLDPGLVFFEVLNEPEISDSYRWSGIQSQLAVAIREGAPNHTIIATGARWSADDDLLRMSPLHDPNVIYNFHFYEPHLFTHQGATWGVNNWHFLKNVPYPSSPDAVRSAEELEPDPINRLYVQRYGEDRWGPERIKGEIQQVSDWAQHWNVPVTCNEFGVFRRANVADRARWLSDVRTTLEADGIGWAMWDYNGEFGVVVRENGVTTPDEITLKALGLKPAAYHKRF